MKKVVVVVVLTGIFLTVLASWIGPLAPVTSGTSTLKKIGWHPQGNEIYYIYEAKDDVDGLKRIVCYQFKDKKWSKAKIMRVFEEDHVKAGSYYKVLELESCPKASQFLISRGNLEAGRIMIQVWDCQFSTNYGRFDQCYEIAKLETDKEPEQPICLSAQVAGDPPIWSNIMVFPTPEHFLGSDLNDDGDINDTILRYQNLMTGEVINTGLIVSGTHHSIDIYKHIIAFVGENSHIYYYDTHTGIVGETGDTGLHPSIYENIIAFDSKGVICYFDLNTQTLTNTEFSGNSPHTYKGLIVFHTCNPEPTIYFYDLHTGAEINTGIIGRHATLYENFIAFETPEFSIAKDLNSDGDTKDWVIRYYNLAAQTIANTSAVGRYPVLHGNRIVFMTPERSVNQDLNGDSRILGSVIRYYDLEKGYVVNTQELGTEPDIYDDTIAFYLWEHWIAMDLSGDGDQYDPIVGIHQINMNDSAASTTVGTYKNSFLYRNNQLEDMDDFSLYMKSVIPDKSPEKKNGICLGTLFLALVVVGRIPAYFKRIN